ncbi:hypothetical protein LTR85_000689 [Meristemomyces frigidus]|nr:hypothetical protein LTR85_000689 [Meristemomyces frigidus]
MADARNNIPSPPGLPIIGNILDIQNEVPVKGIEHIVDLYGPIVKLNLFGKERITIASVDLLEELVDEKRFWKSPGDGLASLESTSKDAEKNHTGLFTATSEEDMDWQQAHRTLMPAFGPISIQSMFGEMHDIASQLVLKWARMGPTFRIPVTADFTRLTLDTIALCAMDYRFNSFYQDELHPFVQAMNTSLTASSDRLKLSSLVRKMLPWDKSGEKLKVDREYMKVLSRDLVQVRRDNPTDKRDLLNAMVKGKDPKTGDMMPDGLISANMVTFLIAGHETTSGLLSFAFVNLLQNPEAYFKAQQEVDRVVGRGKVRIEHMKDLKYIEAVLRETLRLTPTVPAFTRSMRHDNPNDFEPLAGGKYAVNRNDKILCLISKTHRDPKVYGENANEFQPDRMLDENFQRLPKAAWKPFGSGVRACNGRAFAWQEAQMAIALLLQTFIFRLDDPSYEMKIKQTLTLKPDEFYMRATLREGITAASLQRSLSSAEDTVTAAVHEGISRTGSGLTEDLKPLTILFGTNTGTCMSLAQKLSLEARRHGYQAHVVDMDAVVETIPKDHPVAIITASYEGEPPDNAAQFVTWLEMIKGEDTLSGLEYAVFGCGHSDWQSTFHRIPKLVDELLEKHGAKRIAPRGLSNAADGDMFSDFDTWTEHTFWPAVAPSSVADHEVSTSLDMEMAHQNRSSYLRQDVQRATVVDAKGLTALGEPEKRHLEVRLPAGMTYEAGDYLAVLPLNPAESVARVMKHFGLASDTTINIKAGAATFLPTGVTLSVADVLRGFVELNLPATKRDLQSCIPVCKSPMEKAALDVFTDKDNFAQITEQRVSLLDLLEKYPSIELAFGAFLSMLAPLRPRHYSISSSPLADPTTCSITYSRIEEAARSGVGRYIGVTGAYLSSLKSGDEILVSVRATNKFFHLPADVANTPVILFGAGTGLAPFRGFIQERAQQIAAGRQLAPALMFMGCRFASRDRLYGEEMDAWAKAGAIDIRYAFSRQPESSEGCRYVQDRLLKDKADVLQMWQNGARFFTCGSPEVSEGLSRVAQQILVEERAQRGEPLTMEQAKEWFVGKRNERFVVDVFA